jgi:hypothetical protein
MATARTPLEPYRNLAVAGELRGRENPTQLGLPPTPEDRAAEGSARDLVRQHRHRGRPDLAHPQLVLRRGSPR